MATETINDGGPAFPMPVGSDGGESGHFRLDEVVPGNQRHLMGMTLRDYLAAKAMQAAFAGPGARMVADRDDRYDETNWAYIVASNAYEMADAMLKARAAR